MPFGANDEIIFGADDEAVPEDAPLPRGGGPQRGRKYVTKQERTYRGSMAAAMGEAKARTGVLDYVTNAAINAPADILNSGARLLAGGVGRVGNFLGLDNTFEADARDPAKSFGRIPLLTDAGRQVESGIGEAMPDWLRNVDPAVFDALNVAGAKGLGDMMGNAARPRQAMLPGAAETMGEVAARPDVRPGSVNPGQAAALYGLDVSPVELQHARPTLEVGGFTQFMERAGGAGLGESRALGNAPKLNEAAARAAGIDPQMLPPGSLLTEKVFNDAKVPHEAVYERGRDIPGEGSSAQYTRDLGGIKTRGSAQAADSEISRLQQEYADAGSSAQIVQDIKVLRRNSSKNIQNADAAKNDVGFAQRKIADALENELARRAIASGDVGYAAELAGARRALAKIYTVEDATWADHFDVSKLVAAKQHGAPLTDDLAVLADIGERLPRSMRHTLDVAGAPSGAEASAAGLEGLLTRLSQNLFRRAGGQGVVNRFNRQLGGQVEGMTPEGLFPDEFAPNYDFDPRLLGENFGPPDQLFPPGAPTLDEILALDAPQAGIPVPPQGINEAQLGLSAEGTVPWQGGGGAPPARPYALDLQEIQDALGIKEPLAQQEFPNPGTTVYRGVPVGADPNEAINPDAAEWSKFSYPLEGNPTEYVRRPKPKKE